MQKEIFKAITGYENLYQISNLGNVKSLAKGDGNGNRDRLLKFGKRPGTNNYPTRLFVVLCKQGKTKKYSVHRLVATHFIPNTENKPQVNHIDNDTQNNVVSNLEWVTGKENMAHSIKQGRQKQPIIDRGKQTAKLRQNKAEIKYKLLLGNRFVSTSVEKHGKNSRRVVSYYCICGNVYTDRVCNAPLRIRAGICRYCKDEDIVSSA